MRTIAKVLVLSLATALAAPAYAAPAGGGMGGGGGGAILSSGGGGGARGGGGAVGGGGGFAARAQTGSRSGFSPQGQTSGFANGGQGDWRHHHGYWPGAAYGYGYGYDYGDDYYDEPDVNQCLVYRKVYNARGLFVGWRQVNVCSG